LISGLRAICVLALCAASLALLGWQLGSDDLGGFPFDNILALSTRRLVITSVMATASLTAVTTAAYAWLFGAPAVARLRSFSRLSAPLLLSGFVPGLLHRGSGEPLMTGLVIAAFTLASEALLRLTFAEVSTYLGGSHPFEVNPRRRKRLWLLATAAGAIFYAAYMSRFTVFSHRRFGTYNFDLGQYDNIFWSALHGKTLRCSPLGNLASWSELSNHAELSVYFLLPFYALRPNAETLLIMQSCFLGLGAIPIYLFAARRLPPRSAFFLTACYLLYPPLHGANFYDFHFQPIASTFVLFTIYFIDTRRWILATITCIVALGCREDVSIGLSMLGLYLLFSGYRVRPGALLSIAGATYFVIMRFFIMPHFGQNWFSDMYKDLYPQPDGPHSYGGVVMSLVSNPTYVFRTLLTADKLRYFLQIAAPIAFLPLRRAYLLPALVPGAMFTLLTTAYAPTTDIGFQYSCHYIPYLFTASALALASYGSLGQRAVGRFPAALTALGIGTFLCTAQWGAFPPRGTIRGGFVDVAFSRPTPADEQKARDLAELAAMIPSEAMFAVTEEELPHVSGRLNVLGMKYGVGNAEYVLYATSGQGSYVGAQALADGSFIEIAKRPGLMLLKRK
jgi:uncharacterized membrane protein